MLNKICMYFCGLMFFFCFFAFLTFVYLTRVGFYNAIVGLILCVLTLLGVVCFGAVAVMLENIVEDKRK